MENTEEYSLRAIVWNLFCMENTLLQKYSKGKTEMDHLIIEEEV
jgi:hypothetical protein